MNIKTEILKKAKELYPKGTLFKSVTQSNTMLVVSEIRWSEIYDCIINTSGGVIYEDGIFAEIIVRNEKLTVNLQNHE